MKQIPNLFTLLNLFLGSVAIIYILQPGASIAVVEDGNLLIHLPEKLAMASFFIFAAGIVDFLDGFLARWMNATSEMGKQLDSLSDVVTFGVAPSMIFYQLLRMSYLQEESALDTSALWLLPALLVACCAAWRLAKFNIDERQHVSFRGVPTPITAMMVASLPLIAWYNTWELAQLVINRWLLYGLIFLLSYLMVSDIPIMSLKFKDYTLKSNRPKVLLAACALIYVVVFSWAALPLIYVTYVALSLWLRKQIS
jgi:CDP-diacylglycerol--serine O-phosphatidyltransferase